MNEDEGKYGLVQNFYVDDGELNGLSPQMCFVLGAEFEMIFQAIERGEPFERMFHSDNEARVRRMCIDRGVEFSISVHDDWPVLSVQPAQGERE